MGEVKIDLSQTQYKSLGELKSAADENLKNIGGYTDAGQTQIFGGENGLKEGATKDEVLSLLQKNGVTSDVAEGLWAVANTNTADEIIDADEFASLIEMYGSSFHNEQAGEYTNVTITSWINHVNNPRTGSASATTEADATQDAAAASGAQTSAEASAATLETSSETLLNEMQAQIEAQDDKKTETKTETETKQEIAYTDQFKNFDSKVKQDENGQYYVETDKWDTNAKDNLDCISRIVYNTYGVGWKSEEGQAILTALQAANPGTPFERGLVYPNQRINLIDASEILGLTITDTSSADSTDGASDSTPVENNSGNADGTQGNSNDPQTPQVITLEERTKDLSNVKMINTDGRTKTFEGVNANGETITYTQDYKGELVGNVKAATKDENGNITLVNDYAKDGTYTALWYSPGGYPHQFAKAECDAQGNRTSIIKYEYSAEHPSKMVKREICDGNENTITTEEITWNDDYTSIVGRKYTNPEGKLTDEKGNLLDEQQQAANGVPAGTQAYTKEELLQLGKDESNDDSFANYLTAKGLDIYNSSTEALQTAADDYQKIINQKNEFTEMTNIIKENPALSGIMSQEVGKDSYGNAYTMQDVIESVESYGAFETYVGEDVNAVHNTQINNAVGYIKNLVNTGAIAGDMATTINNIAAKYENQSSTVTIKTVEHGEMYNAALNQINSTRNSSGTTEAFNALNSVLGADNLTSKEKADLTLEVLGTSNGTAGDAKYDLTNALKKELRTNINNFISDSSDNGLSTDELIAFAQSFEVAYGEPLYIMMNEKENKDTNKNFAARIMDLYSNATSANYDAIANTFPMKESVQDMLKGKEETKEISSWLENLNANAGTDAESYGINYERFQEISAYADNVGGPARSTSAMLKEILDSNNYNTNEKMYLVQRLYNGKTNGGSIDKFTTNFRDGNDKFQEEYLQKLIKLYVDFKSQA